MSVAASRSDAILERLLHIHPKGIDLKLNRIERLLAALGNPERKMPPTFHVAGTNGKGSTCAFLRAMLEASGRRVHVYTSPHLVRFNERIRVAGQLISDEEIADVLEECERVNDGQEITFFEIFMCAAFLVFSRHPADALVLEVGLGGKYDATNVIAKPQMTVITPIGIDHAEFFGTQIANIAAEKAGIVKPRVPLVVGQQDDVPRDVIVRRADALNAPVFVLGEDFFAHVEHGRLTYQDDHGLLDLPLPKLIGQHQIENAATAIAALRHAGAGWAVEGAIETGLRRVEWPARLQRLTRGPLVAMAPPGSELWLDGGHNPHGAAAVSRALADLEERSPKPLYLICVMQVDAWSRARAGDDAPRILICGSLYLAGRVLAENS